MAVKQNNKAEDNNTSVASEQIVDSEKEELKKQVIELQEMMKTLLQSQQEKQVKSEDVSEQRKSIYQDIEEELNISPHAQIKIMSMVIGGLNLRATHHILNIPDFGQVRTVSFEDLRSIVNNHPDFARDGAFIILNEKAVRALYLENEYEKLMSRSDVEGIINLSPDQIQKNLQSSTRTQLQSIIHFVLREIPKGDSRYLDYNKLIIFSNFVGTDIYQLAMELDKMK